MSINVALSAALTGLSASSRMAQTVSNNLANATTEGYGKRTVVTGSLVAGGAGVGVRVVAIERAGDPVLTASRRLADADSGVANASADFFARLEGLVGTPNDPGSLSGRLDVFESSLVTAANTPESDAALSGILFAADAVTDKMNSISSGIQTARSEIDTEIATSVNLINNTLKELEFLNGRLLRTRGFGGDGNAILDQQQIMVDKISELIPVREYRDSNGNMRLYSKDGIQLLDVQATQLEFSGTRVVTADMSLGAPLSDLTINGNPLPSNAGEPGLSGGRLRALFEVRDNLAVDAQAKLDAVARDLAERFEDPGLDPTRAALDPGLFTDQGFITDPTTEIGLAGRISVNTLVDPAQGGDVFRIRDGLGVAAPGNVGDASLLQGMTDALANGRITVSGGFTSAPRSMTVLGGELLSIFGAERQFADTAQTFAAARQEGLRNEELGLGVNTDEELQKLIQIERMYEANARVIQAINDMTDALQRALG